MASCKRADGRSIASPSPSPTGRPFGASNSLIGPARANSKLPTRPLARVRSCDNIKSKRRCQ